MSGLLILPLATSLQAFLAVGAGLFAAGLVTVLLRRNAVGILIGMELMLNAANVNLIAFDRYGPLEVSGQLFALFVLVVAAAEAAVALAIIINVFDARDRIDVDQLDELKG